VTTLARIEDLSYWYPGAVSPALRSVDLELDAGLSLVVGESGGGKSTLLRLLNGLVPQFHGGRISGSATVAGLDTLRTPIPRIAARVGLVFQDVETQSVYGTVEREVAFGLENAAMSRAEMHERVGAVLEELSIGHLRSRRLATLSGGERQGLAIVRALHFQADIIILDEPTMGLSLKETEKLLRFVEGIRTAGKSAIFIDHNIFHVYSVSDRIVLLDRGRVAGQFLTSRYSLEELMNIMREVAATGAFTEQERYRREGETVDATTESTEEHA